MRSLETRNIVVLGLEEMSCFSRANVKIDESTCISLLTLKGLRFRPSLVFCSTRICLYLSNHFGIDFGNEMFTEECFESSADAVD